MMSKRKEFSFRVAPFSDGDWCEGRQVGASHTSCRPFEKMTDNIPCVHVYHFIILHLVPWIKILADDILKYFSYFFSRK